MALLTFNLIFVHVSLCVCVCVYAQDYVYVRVCEPVRVFVCERARACVRVVFISSFGGLMQLDGASSSD